MRKSPFVFCCLLLIMLNGYAQEQDHSQELRIITKTSKIKILSPKNYLLINSNDSASKDIIKIHGHLISSTLDSIKLLTYNFRADTFEDAQTIYKGFHSPTADWQLTVSKSDINTITSYRDKRAYKRREFAMIGGAALLFTGFVTSFTAFVAPDKDSRSRILILGAAEALLGFGLVIPLSKKEYQFKQDGNAKFPEF